MKINFLKVLKVVAHLATAAPAVIVAAKQALSEVKADRR